MKISVESLKIGQPLVVAVDGSEKWLDPLYACFLDGSEMKQEEMPLCRGDLELTRFDNFLEIAGRFNFAPFLDCGRCAESIPWMLDGKIEYTVDTSPEALQNAGQEVEEYELSEADLHSLSLGVGAKIDLVEVFEDAISMAMPVVSTPDRDENGACLLCRKDCNSSQVYGLRSEDDPTGPFAKLKNWKSTTKH